MSASCLREKKCRVVFVAVYEYVVIPAFIVFMLLSSCYMSTYSFKFSLFLLNGGVSFTINPLTSNDDLVLSLRVWWPELLIGGLGYAVVAGGLYYLYRRFVVEQRRRNMGQNGNSQHQDDIALPTSSNDDF